MSGRDHHRHLGVRAFWILWALAAFFSAPHGLTLALELQMKIDDVKFDNGAVVRFLQTGSSSQNVPSETLGKMVASETHDKQFTVFSSIDEISVYPSFENYVFYVRSASAAANAPLTRFTIQAVPYDAFADQDRMLTIHLLEGPKDSAVEISVPVHSLKSAGSLLVKPYATAKVHLSGDTVSIDLVNKYLLPVRITDATVAQVSNAHWLSQPKLRNALPITLGSEQNDNHVTLVWNVQPRALGILRDSLIPITRTSSEDGSEGRNVPASEAASDATEVLEISVHYVPEEGGFAHPMTVYRGIYFYPSLLALTGVSILGAIVGGVIMFYGLRKDSGFRKFLKYLGPTILLALLIQFVAVVLFSFDNSKVQIGVVNLNPMLLIPAGCLGAISVFYGFQLIEKWLGKAGAQP